MSESLSRELWMRAVEDVKAAPLVDQDPRVVTLAEFRVLVGNVHRDTATRIMRGLLAAGKAERTRKYIRRQDDVVLHVSAYRLLDAPQGSAHDDRRHPPVDRSRPAGRRRRTR